MISREFDPSSVTGKTVKEIVDNWAQSTPENIFLIDPDNNIILTYKDLQKSCQGVAGILRRSGAKPGDPVAYAMNNGADAACIILGCMYGGYLSTAVNLVAGKTTIAHVLNHSEAVIVAVDSNSDELVSDALQECRSGAIKIMVTPDWFVPQANEIIEGSSERDALLMYTSGTTGLPKGVSLLLYSSNAYD